MGKRRNNSHQIKYMLNFKGNIKVFFSEELHYFHDNSATPLPIKNISKYFFYQQIQSLTVSFKSHYKYGSANLITESSPSHMLCVFSSSCTVPHVQGTKESLVTSSKKPKLTRPLQQPATLLGPSPIQPRGPSSAEHSQIQSCGRGPPCVPLSHSHSDAGSLRQDSRPLRILAVPRL